ncbi:hypothetical protein ACWESL_26055, partial [Streptosporangium sandarakinum]
AAVVLGRHANPEWDGWKPILATVRDRGFRLGHRSRERGAGEPRGNVSELRGQYRAERRLDGHPDSRPGRRGGERQGGGYRSGRSGGDREPFRGDREPFRSGGRPEGRGNRHHGR